MDISADGSTLAGADAIQDGTDEVLHLIDLKTGVDSPLRMPRGPGRSLVSMASHSAPTGRSSSAAAATHSCR